MFNAAFDATLFVEELVLTDVEMVLYTGTCVIQWYVYIFKVCIWVMIILRNDISSYKYIFYIMNT